LIRSPCKFLIFSRYKEEQKGRRLVEIEKMRNLIARNLHDDIGSTLSSINILSKVALKQAAENTSVCRDLEKIKDSSFAIMESMGDIVWAINPINDPLDRTILKMREFAAGILEPAGINFTFTEEGKILDVKLGADARKNLYLIFKEAVNNIAKYSGAVVTDIKLHSSAHQFLLTITDNGKGFDSSTTYGGNGLKNMRIRAEEIKAAFEIISKPAEGTRIRVVVPIT
jgi:signal transduction histidine kinase